jgi:hypothetical protein
MKTNVILIIAIFSGQILLAQDKDEEIKNSWRSEYGYAFTGSGDLSGYCVYNEYSRKLSDRFKISPAIGIMNFQHNSIDNFDNSNSLLQNANSKSFEVAGYLTQQIFDLFGFEIGLGGLFRNWEWIYATGDNASFGTDDFHLEPSEYGTLTNNSFGYSISMGVQIDLNKQLGLNLRGVYQNDSNSDNAVTARLGINFGF